MAADDVAKAVGQIAVGPPVNGIVEVAGPQQFRFDDLIRQGLSAAGFKIAQQYGDYRLVPYRPLIVGRYDGHRWLVLRGHSALG